MYAVRLWSVRHARGLNGFYKRFERLLVRLAPLWRGIGYEQLERPVAAVERSVKGLLFDCRMCGQCVLSSTGMSCPMNCPKTLRNGPCGGVRDDGTCEVKPNMRCVWLEAYRGSERIPDGTLAMRNIQFAVDQRLQGRSSWLRVVREKTEPAPLSGPAAGKAVTAPGAAPATLAAKGPTAVPTGPTSETVTTPSESGASKVSS